MGGVESPFDAPNCPLDPENKEKREQEYPIEIVESSGGSAKI
jgi:hypothetical protein